MRRCAKCGEGIRRGDPAIRAMGEVFCSEDCADDYEQYGPPAGRDYDEIGTFEGVDVYGSLS
jgi:hypothetical protein